MTEMRHLLRYERCLQPLPMRPLLFIAVGVQVLTFLFALATGFSPTAYQVGLFTEGFFLGPTVAGLVLYLVSREWREGGYGMWLSLPAAGTTKLVARLFRVCADTVVAWLPSAAVFCLGYLGGHLVHPRTLPLGPALIGHAAWILVGVLVCTPLVAAYIFAIGFWSQRVARIGGYRGFAAFTATYVAVYAGLFALVYNTFGTSPQEPWRTLVAPNLYIPVLPVAALYALCAIWIVWTGRWLDNGAEVRGQRLGWKWNWK